MDIEERLEKAEELPAPSLVGSSIRSADDSAHNNYIHPEKSKRATKPPRYLILNSLLGASLDDLINEGALISEENFDFLDDVGNVKSESTFQRDAGDADLEAGGAETEAGDAETEAGGAETKEAKPKEAVPKAESSLAKHPVPEKPSSMYASDNYSAPNLSEYQLENEITSHDDLLDLVQSYDPDKLPSLEHRERLKGNEPFAAVDRLPRGLRGSPARAGPSFSSFDPVEHLRAARSPMRRDRLRLRSRLANVHLARGDSYKNVHPETPDKYELPADMQLDEEDEEDDRRTRQLRPTLGESIAAAEKEQELQNLHQFHGEPTSRDPSLVTTGDYTNFDSDSRDAGDAVYSVRSQSSTNYLRSISRSRSRQPARNHSVEKNDADVQPLVQEGALVSDDPIDQVEGLDSVLDDVLKGRAHSASSERDSLLMPREAEAGKGSEVDAESESEVAESEAPLNERVKEDKATETLKDPVTLQGPTDKSFEGASTLITEPHIDASKTLEVEQDIEGGQDDIEEEQDGSEEEEDGSEEGQDGSEETPAKADGETSPKVYGETSAKVDGETSAKVDGETSAVNGETPKLPVSESQAKGTPRETEEEHKDSSKVSDVSAETKVKESELQLRTADAPEVDASDIHVKGVSKVEEKPVEKTEVEASPVEEADVDAEQRVEEAAEQIADKEAPTVSAADIKISPKDLPLDVQSTDVKPLGPLEEVESPEKKSLEVGEKGKALDKDVTHGESEIELDRLSKDVVSSTGAEKPDDAKEFEAKTDVSESENVTKPETKVSETVAKEVKGESETSEKADSEKESSPLKKETSDAEAESLIAGIAALGAALATGVAAALGFGAKETPKETMAEAKTATDEDFDVSPEELRKHLESLPVYIFTSLAGGMQIMHKTNRLSTILLANGVKFEYRDLGTDEEAKKLWRRYAQGKTLPGVVRGDDFIGNWHDIDEINEEYRLHEVLYETL